MSFLIAMLVYQRVIPWWLAGYPTSQPSVPRIPRCRRQHVLRPQRRQRHLTTQRTRTHRAPRWKGHREVWVGAWAAKSVGISPKLGKCLGFFLISMILWFLWDRMRSYEFLFDEKHACSMIYLWFVICDLDDSYTSILLIWFWFSWVWFYMHKKIIFVKIQYSQLIFVGRFETGDLLILHLAFLPHGTDIYQIEWNLR